MTVINLGNLSLVSGTTPLAIFVGIWSVLPQTGDRLLVEARGTDWKYDTEKQTLSPSAHTRYKIEAKVAEKIAPGQEIILWPEGTTRSTWVLVPTDEGFRFELAADRSYVLAATGPTPGYDRIVLLPKASARYQIFRSSKVHPSPPPPVQPITPSQLPVQPVFPAKDPLQPIINFPKPQHLAPPLTPLGPPPPTFMDLGAVRLATSSGRPLYMILGKEGFVETSTIPTTEWVYAEYTQFVSPKDNVDWNLGTMTPNVRTGERLVVGPSPGLNNRWLIRGNEKDGFSIVPASAPKIFVLAAPTLRTFTLQPQAATKHYLLLFSNYAPWSPVVPLDPVISTLIPTSPIISFVPPKPLPLFVPGSLTWLYIVVAVVGALVLLGVVGFVVRSA